LVEGDLQRSQVRVADRMTRFAYDYPLLFALVDRWRPETHTFHLPVGEMTPTLQDVALLLGLPLAGQAMGAIDVDANWRQGRPVRDVGPPDPLTYPRDQTMAAQRAARGRKTKLPVAKLTEDVDSGAVQGDG
jgi:hypothetical protein